MYVTDLYIATVTDITHSILQETLDGIGLVYIHFYSYKILHLATLHIVALTVFNIVSNLPEQHPFFGVFNFSMVPVLFIAGGIIFVLAILRN